MTDPSYIHACYRGVVTGGGALWDFFAASRKGHPVDTRQENETGWILTWCRQSLILALSFTFFHVRAALVASSRVLSVHFRSPLVCSFAMRVLESNRLLRHSSLGLSESLSWRHLAVSPQLHSRTVPSLIFAVVSGWSPDRSGTCPLHLPRGPLHSLPTLRSTFECPGGAYALLSLASWAAWYQNVAPRPVGARARNFLLLVAIFA